MPTKVKEASKDQVKQVKNKERKGHDLKLDLKELLSDKETYRF